MNCTKTSKTNIFGKMKWKQERGKVRKKWRWREERLIEREKKKRKFSKRRKNKKDLVAVVGELIFYKFTAAEQTVINSNDETDKIIYENLRGESAWIHP